MAFPAPPPLQYDPNTGTYRAAHRFSAPSNLLWALGFLLLFVGFGGPAMHGAWIAAGAVGLILLAVEVGRHRRGRRATAHR